MIARIELAVLALALAAFASGCDQGGDSSEAAPIDISLGTVGQQEGDLLARSAAAPWNVRYSGTRRVESHLIVDGLHKEFAYREAVHADGFGRFAVEPLEIQSFVDNTRAAMLLLKAREGFLYRYRDFQIRDLGLVHTNYVVSDAGAEVEVAGRPCNELRFERNAGDSVIVAALDQASGLVLRFEERDQFGALVTLMEFETFDAAPDLTDVVWFTPGDEEKALDPALSLQAQVGSEVFEPSVYPAGFRLWKASTLVDDTGATWIKEVLCDGIETLFFMHQIGGEDLQTAAKADEVWSYEIGAVSVVQGVLRHREVVALGKVPADDLLDLIESAID